MDIAESSADVVAVTMIGSDRRRTRARQQSEDVKSDAVAENSDPTEHVRRRRRRPEADVGDNSSPHNDRGSHLDESYAKTYKLSENELGYHSKESPSRKLTLSKEGEFDIDPGKDSPQVSKASLDGVSRLAHRHGDRLSASNTNLEKSGLDPRVYIPAGRVSSRQSAFEEKANTSGSPSRPILTRSNSKPLAAADSEKFRRNLEAWGERSELQHKSQKCESIADLRTVDLSRQIGSGSQNFVDAKLSSAKSSVTLNRTANLKADVGGLVSRWESRQTFAEDEKISSMKPLTGVGTSHSPSIPIVTRPVAEIRQRIQPKSTPAPQRTVLGKPGFRDVRKQWESQGVDSAVKLMRTRSKSPVTVSSSRSQSGSESSKKMVSRSQRPEDVTLTTKHNVANSSQDYNRAPVRLSKSTEHDQDKMSVTNKCDVSIHSDIGNVKCDSDTSVHSDIGNAKCDSDSGNISVDSDLVNISTDSEVANNSVENCFVNNRIEDKFVLDRTENELVISNTENNFDMSKVDKESSTIRKMGNDVTPVEVDLNIGNKLVDSGFVNLSSDVESLDHSDAQTYRNNGSMNNRRKNVAERQKIENDPQMHQDNHVSTKESVGKKINRKFGYVSYDDEKVNNGAVSKESFMDNVSVNEKADSQSDRESRSAKKPMNLEIEMSGKESVGQKINRTFGRKFRERFESSEMWNVGVESDSSVDLRNKAIKTQKGDVDGKETVHKESVGKVVNTIANDRPHSDFENKEMESDILHRNYIEELKSDRGEGKIQLDRKIEKAVASSDVGNFKPEREVGKGKVMREKDNENSNSDAETRMETTAFVENRNSSKNLVRGNSATKKQKEVESVNADSNAVINADDRLANVRAESEVVALKCTTDNEPVIDSNSRGGVKHRFRETLGRENVDNVAVENWQHGRKGKDSANLPPVIAQLNKSVHSTEEKRERILRKLEGNDDAKTSSRKVIQKIGFKDIRNRWEDKSVRETAPSVKSQAQNKGDKSTVNMKANVEKSYTIKSAPPVKPKPRRWENSSEDSTEPGTSGLSGPIASRHDDQRHPETSSSSSSDESGCEDHDEVFAQSLDKDKTVPDHSKDNILCSSSKGEISDSAPVMTCSTVRAKVVKIQPDSPSRVKTEKGKPLSRSNSGTWPAKKCVTYTAKVTYTQKVVDHHDNKGQRAQDTNTSSSRISVRQSSDIPASKTEKNIQGPLANHKIENSEKPKARNRTNIGSSSSNQGGSSAKHSGHLTKSVDTSSTDRGMKPRLPKSPSLPEGRHSRSNVLSPTSPTASRSKHTKGCAPELVKTRQNLRSTKSNGKEGPRQFERNHSVEKTEQTRKDRNVPSVFERLHSNLPARKSLSVRDLREKEPCGVKLRKSPSRSSLRGSFRSSKSKRLSGDGVSEKRRSSSGQMDDKLNSSQVDTRTTLDKSGDVPLDISRDENVLKMQSCSVENSVDSSKERLTDNTEILLLNSQSGENISDENNPSISKVSEDFHFDTNQCDETVKDQNSVRNKDSQVASSVAPSRRTRRSFRESIDQENSVTNNETEPVEPSESENGVHVRRVRRRISSKDADLPNTVQRQDEAPVARERRCRHLYNEKGMFSKERFSHRTR